MKYSQTRVSNTVKVFATALRVVYTVNAGHITGNRRLIFKIQNINLGFVGSTVMQMQYENLILSMLLLNKEECSCYCMK